MKNSIKRIKRQITDCKKIFSNHVSDKGLVSRINKQLSKPKYTKSVLKKGDKTNFPKKGDVVHCWYTGTLQDGTVFDTNIQTSKSKHNLTFLTLRH